MIDINEVLALLDEIEPYPEEWPQGEQGAALAAYLRVSRARQAIAAVYGMNALQLMRAERNRSNKGGGWK
ncbi:MAG: hypothetical protein H0W95_00065 [Nocardioidaceae bacterium]|nr:hypothetical protein [Nocardioidaceae bacterium]